MCYNSAYATKTDMEVRMDEHTESGSDLGEPGESGSETDLAGETDLRSPSQGTLRQPTSQQRSTAQLDPSAELRAGLDRLEEQIEEAIERRLQSGKDRHLRRLERELQALKETVTLQNAASKAEKERAAPAGPPRNDAGDEGASAPSAPRRASHVIQPSGGGLPPAPDLRAEYERRVSAVRPGDVARLLEVKREFRKRGLEVF